ncbi:unnamed protein product [Chrysodeixis includens]|uniref:Peptidase S1 domain-containing protein n=1 Tax=Chrysodeixis includens TaxID=689277 RepID=A0A9N8KZH9_CHRIL|nr:unnamed protein product [Chrysodeixis includens]
MIGALSSLLAVALAAPAFGQGQDFGLVSPCPTVFMYEPLGAEPGKWYGNINLATDTPLYALWLNIGVDSKADLLGNWIGEVTTDNNIDFKIENPSMKITPQAPLHMRFFIQYNVKNKPPKLLNIRFNGKEICTAKPERIPTKIDITTTTTARTVTTSRVNERQQLTTQRTTPKYWIQATTESPVKAVDKKQTTIRPQLWPEAFFQVVKDANKQTPNIPTTPTRVTNNQPVKTEPKQQPQVVPETKTQPIPAVYIRQPDDPEPKPKPLPVIDFWPNRTPAKGQRPITFIINNEGTQDQGNKASQSDQPIYERPKVQEPSGSRKPVQTESPYTVPPKTQEDDIIGKWPVEQPSRWSDDGQNYDKLTVAVGGDRIKIIGVNKTEINLFIFVFMNSGNQDAGRRDQVPTRYQATTQAPPSRTQAPEIADFDNIDDAKDDDQYYGGGLPTIYIPAHVARVSDGNCGIATEEARWPWQIALYQQQTVDFKYICGGTLVSRRHVVTAAHCVCRKRSSRIVNPATLTMFLGKPNLRASGDGVQVKFVSSITVHPNYNSTTFDRNVAILNLQSPVTYSTWVQPACLWPEAEVDLGSIIGKRGSVVGWGLGSARQELNLLEMPVVDRETCLGSFADFYRHYTSSYTYCAGYGTSTCNGDSGGGMVFKKGGSWYLRGLVSLTFARRNDGRCDQDQYVIFTDLAKMLPWIEQKIGDY